MGNQEHLPEYARTDRIGPLSRSALMYQVLDAAVPLWIKSLKDIPDDHARWERAQSWINEDTLQSAGVFSEILVVGGGRKGQAATAFNALAKAIAALTMLTTGGVPFGTSRYFWSAEEKAAYEES